MRPLLPQVAVNASLGRVALAASLDVEGMLKWQLKKSMEQQWAQQKELGMASDGENDMIREMLLETQPWLLAVTMLVSVLRAAASHEPRRASRPTLGGRVPVRL